MGQGTTTPHDLADLIHFGTYICSYICVHHAQNSETESCADVRTHVKLHFDVSLRNKCVLVQQIYTRSSRDDADRQSCVARGAARRDGRGRGWSRVSHGAARGAGQWILNEFQDRIGDDNLRATPM